MLAISAYGCLSTTTLAGDVIGFEYLDLSIDGILIGRDTRTNKSKTYADPNNLNVIRSNHIKTMQFSPDINAAMILQYEQSRIDRALNQQWVGQQQDTERRRDGGHALQYLLRKSALRLWMIQDDSDEIDLKVINVDDEGNMSKGYKTGFRYDLKLNPNSDLSIDNVKFNVEYEF
ncbi:hypothetical protein [Sinobacterium norvegicum]|uniref:hypothetical protein n=1 Tax=Sinobacterium norvegicum TaxID=1641715 RepID=UPI001F32829E|nr:hypothetical protein [Sinobacterium norvegicum]